MTSEYNLIISGLSPAADAQSSAPGRMVGPVTPLVRKDLLDFEQILLGDLQSLLPFTAHSLYFPLDQEIKAPEWIAEEHKLLLPLRQGKNLLGVLLLREPDPTAVAPLLPFLPQLVALLLDKLALYKWGRADALTGLYTKTVFLERLGYAMAQVRQNFAAGSESALEGTGQEFASSCLPQEEASFHGSLGIMVIHFPQLGEITRNHGYTLVERLLVALSNALQDALPEQAFAARVGDEEFAVLLPGVVQRDIEPVAHSVLTVLDGVSVPSPLTGVPLYVRPSLGYSLFPQNWEARHEGREGRNASAEAESLLYKARLATLRAGEMGRNGERVMGYSTILPQGGLVDAILPLARIQTTLGREVGAREGQRFTVWSVDYPVQTLPEGGSALPEPVYKGEIVLADVREGSSQADILLLSDPAWPLEPGDHLSLVEEDYGLTFSEGGSSGRPDSLTGLYRHGDFLAKLAVVRELHPAFGLVLIRFHFPRLLASEHPLSGRQQQMEHAMADAAALLRQLLEGHEAFQATGEDVPSVLMGRYSLNSILLFHPGLMPEEAKGCYEPIARKLMESLQAEAAVGVACLPWLSYRAGDALECCGKALEYALLLPAPHVGVFDSLAINISADKRYSQGNIFGAIEEYRLALLADENNSLAWNSLGVCLAGVGRHEEAHRAFERAAKRDPRDAAIRYNLGTACIQTGDLEGAARHFRLCLELEPDYSFADIKLGELAQASGQLEDARVHYELARQSDPASPVPYRCLARLELLGNAPGKAREHLHQALLRNPQDSFSLHLMARLYLDGGEDPELAETLARQSVTLRPDGKAAWLELARALEAQGRVQEAQEARRKAGVL